MEDKDKEDKVAENQMIFVGILSIAFGAAVEGFSGGIFSGMGLLLFVCAITYKMDRRKAKK